MTQAHRNINVVFFLPKKELTSVLPLGSFCLRMTCRSAWCVTCRTTRGTIPW